MFIFPDNLYVDVRIEESSETQIRFKEQTLEGQKIRQAKGAFIRVFDGRRWYYSSTTDLQNIQTQIDTLVIMARPNPDILTHPIVEAFEVNKATVLKYEQEAVTDIPIEDKQTLLETILQQISDCTIVSHNSYYMDKRVLKSFYSSKGADITFDQQVCGIRISLDIVCGENKDQVVVSKGASFFKDLKTHKNYFIEEITKNIAFVSAAVPVVPGDYPILLSPEATGIFTHESFGHKSESDFMVGDETMREEWALGKRIGLDLLNIIDDGTITGSGYVPFDDEGTKGRKTAIISAGNLTGRLHSAATSAALDEGLTGNARAVNFEFEPIVRMTTTYIEKGTKPLKDIIAEMDHGIYLETLKHGSGMSTFTLAPARAYKIEGGKITSPVKISVVTGDVFNTLEEVDAISEEFELSAFVGGGCGKMEQYPLLVGFGGPYTRVQKLKVQ